MKSCLSSPAFRRCAIAVFVAATAGMSATAQPPDPADPAAPVASPSPDPGLPATARGYLQRVDEPRLPWPALYEPDGSFVSRHEEMASRPHSSMHAPVHGTAPATAPAASPSPSGSDARGVVRAVDLAAGKVTLKHGPIERLEMPGMTMIFRVKDPALLQGLEPGAQIEFDVSVENNTFYVTGIRQ